MAMAGFKVGFMIPEPEPTHKKILIGDSLGMSQKISELSGLKQGPDLHLIFIYKRK